MLVLAVVFGLMLVFVFGGSAGAQFAVAGVGVGCRV